MSQQNLALLIDTMDGKLCHSYREFHVKRYFVAHEGCGVESVDPRLARSLGALFRVKLR